MILELQGMGTAVEIPSGLDDDVGHVPGSYGSFVTMGLSVPSQTMPLWVIRSRNAISCSRADCKYLGILIFQRHSRTLQVPTISGALPFLVLSLTRTRTVELLVHHLCNT